MLLNGKTYAIGVAADVVGTDGQVRDLETLDAMDVEALIEHTVLDDGVTLPRSHTTGTQAVPSGLNVALNCIGSS